MSGFMDCAGLSDIGKRRSSNEDQFLIADVCRTMRIHQTSLLLDHQTRLSGNTQWKLMLVADGLGGHEAGERASQLVVDGVIDFVLNQLDWCIREKAGSKSDLETSLKSAVFNCQAKVEHEVAAIPQRSGMGSTLTLAFVVWPRLYLAHIGDSRCYLLRDGLLKQLTRDHTLAELNANSMLSGSEIDYERDVDLVDTNNNPMSNVLWNVIGGGVDNEPDPDTQSLELRMGDTLILCSDGLSNMLSRQQIKEVLTKDFSTDAMCKELVSLANDAGGNDNITVVISRFLDNEKGNPEMTNVKLAIRESSSDTDEFISSGGSAVLSENPSY